MLKTLVTGLTPLTLGVTLLAAPLPPAEAIPVIIQTGNYIPGFQQPSIGSWIYGSPIPTPVPVNPVTGEVISPYQNYYPGWGYRTPVQVPVGRTIQNSTLINPTLVNPNISNSVLINPTIVPSPGYPNQYIRRSGIIYHPGHLQIQIGY